MTYWNESEVQYLSDTIGFLSYREIAFYLHRTAKAIKQKAIKMNLNLYCNFYWANLLASELGVHHKTICKWYKRGYIKGRKAKWNNGYYNPCFIFKEEDIVKFIQEHPEKLKVENVKNLYFKKILCDTINHSGS